MNGNRPLLLLDRLQPRLQYSHLVACMHLSLLIALKSRWILWMTLFVICHTYVVAGIQLSSKGDRTKVEQGSAVLTKFGEFVVGV